MAKDTAISPLKGAPVSGAKLEVYQRTIDFSKTNLLGGDYFELFTMDTGDVVLGGAVIIKGATPNGAELTLGLGGAGTTLLTNTSLTASSVTPLTATAGVSVSMDTVDLAMDSDNASTGTAAVSLWVLKAGDRAG
jgi:hypothetical protein